MTNRRGDYPRGKNKKLQQTKLYRSYSSVLCLRVFEKSVLRFRVLGIWGSNKQSESLSSNSKLKNDYPWTEPMELKLV
ncbi:hypothetical protein L1987_47443 [Smallanthus sonchifolius]|uniref:Uncharacterized protein n=1 Tax=Smallanthus sonchifolius TaxID=185202 RepID=A0ACB9G4C6_9ASTR|nr:hypothetical protein L1987_47443 [Smallanthus sonchifolius]